MRQARRYRSGRRVFLKGTQRAQRCRGGRRVIQKGTQRTPRYTKRNAAGAALYKKERSVRCVIQKRSAANAALYKKERSGGGVRQGSLLLGRFFYI
jgi:hypothetical protein